MGNLSKPEVPIGVTYVTPIDTRESGAAGVGPVEGGGLFGGLDVFAGPGVGWGRFKETFANLFIGFRGAVVLVE